MLGAGQEAWRFGHGQLETVTLDIQRKLRHVPAAQDVRARLLDTALESLSKVSTSLVERSEVDMYAVIAHRDPGACSRKLAT